METVGFIGLGNMGGGMANNIQKAGYPMVVYDLREEAARPFLDGGARLANSPEEVASLCEVTFTSLPGPKEVEEVALGAEGILAGIKPGSIFISSTACLGDTMLRFLAFIVPIGKLLGLLPLVKAFTRKELENSLTDAGFEIDYQWQSGKGKAVFIVAKKA